MNRFIATLENFSFSRLGIVYIISLMSICIALSFFLLGYVVGDRESAEDSSYDYDGAVFDLLERQSTFTISNLLESSEKVIVKYRNAEDNDWHEKVLSISDQFDLAQLLRNLPSLPVLSGSGDIIKYDIEITFNVKGGDFYKVNLEIITGDYCVKKQELDGSWATEKLVMNRSFVSICCSFLRGIGVNFEYTDAPSKFFEQSRK